MIFIDSNKKEEEKINKNKKQTKKENKNINIRKIIKYPKCQN